MRDTTLRRYLRQTECKLCMDRCVVNHLLLCEIEDYRISDGFCNKNYDKVLRKKQQQNLNKHRTHQHNTTL